MRNVRRAVYVGVGWRWGVWVRWASWEGKIKGNWLLKRFLFNFQAPSPSPKLAQTPILRAILLVTFCFSFFGGGEGKQQLELDLAREQFSAKLWFTPPGPGWHPVIMPNPNHFTMGQLTIIESPNAWGWQTLSNQTYKLVNKVAFYGGLEKRFLFLFFLLPDAKLLIL